MSTTLIGDIETNWPNNSKYSEMTKQVQVQRGDTLFSILNFHLWDPDLDLSTWHTFTATHWRLNIMAEILATFSKLLESKSMYCDSNNTDVYALRSNWQYNTIVSGNGVASTRQQVITPIRVERFHWCICALTLYNGCDYTFLCNMMTSSNGNIFRVICEFTGHWWIPSQKASDSELWCFLWSAPEQAVG